MRTLHPLRVMRRATLASLICLGFAATAFGQDTAGRVDFAIGGVTASVKSGVARPLAKGALLFEGDTVSTDATGRAQIRFTDGAYVSLQPNTEFRVDTYRYAGAVDGKEKGFFSLLKGGLRTITGAIGHTRRDAYQVNTLVATIGIRGTEYLAKLGNSLEVSVGDGSLFLLNNAGKFIVDQGQSVYIANQNSVPVITATPPSLPPSPARQSGNPPADAPLFVSGNQTTSSGAPAVVPRSDTIAPPGAGFGNVLPFGSGYALAVSHGFANNSDIGIDCAANPANHCGQPIVTLSSAGVSWVQGTGSSDFQAGAQSGTAGTATFAGGSAGGVIGWGSFTNGTFITAESGTPVKTLGPNEGIHFVMGIPTSPMPNTGSASMNLIGSSRPTFSDNLGNGLGTGTVTGGTLTANFASSFVSTNVNVSFSSGNTFTLNGSGSIIGSGIDGSGSFFKMTGPSTVCYPSPCTTPFLGFFAGPGAGYAGYVYAVTVLTPTTFRINGAVAFH